MKPGPALANEKKGNPLSNEAKHIGSWRPGKKKMELEAKKKRGRGRVVSARNIMAGRETTRERGGKKGRGADLPRLKGKKRRATDHHHPREPQNPFRGKNVEPEPGVPNLSNTSCKGPCRKKGKKGKKK